MEDGKQSEAGLSCTGRGGKLPLGRRGSCPFQRDPQSREDPEREKGKGGMQRELPWRCQSSHIHGFTQPGPRRSHSEFPEQGWEAF